MKTEMVKAMQCAHVYPLGLRNGLEKVLAHAQAIPESSDQQSVI